jgi:uncharacterized membrane protein
MFAMKGIVFRIFPIILGVISLVMIAHIASILMMPHVSARNPAKLLSKTLPLNQLAVLDEQATASVKIPFADPSMKTAVCVYDITEKPLRVNVSTAGSFLSVVFMQPSGKIFYSVTDKSAVQRKLGFVVATQEQISTLESQDPDDEAVQELRLRAPENKGLLIIRALVGRAREAAEVQALLNQTECFSE